MKTILTLIAILAVTVSGHAIAAGAGGGAAGAGGAASSAESGAITESPGTVAPTMVPGNPPVANGSVGTQNPSQPDRSTVVAPYNPEGKPSVNADATTGAPSVAAQAPRAGMQLSHDQVRDAQRALSANGFDVSSDGIAGPQTTDAIRHFQTDHDLPVTGQLDNATLQQLNAATQSVTPPSNNKAMENPSSL